MRALVLCAGYGTRLGKRTADTPKPFLSIEGKPLLEYIVCYLRQHNIKEISINLHYLYESIVDYFGDGNRWGVRITYSYEKKLMGTAGGAKKLEGFLREDDDFLVVYGDVITDQNLKDLVGAHRDSGAFATILCHRNANSTSLISVNDKQRVVEYIERPSESERQLHKSDLANSGIYVLSSEIFRHIPEGVFYDFGSDVFPKIVGSEYVHSYELNGYRCAVDNEARYRQVISDIQNGKLNVDTTHDSE